MGRGIRLPRQLRTQIHRSDPRGNGSRILFLTPGLRAKLIGELFAGIIDRFAEGITTDEFTGGEGWDVPRDAGFAEIVPGVEGAKTGAVESDLELDVGAHERLLVTRVTSIAAEKMVFDSHRKLMTALILQAGPKERIGFDLRFDSLGDHGGKIAWDSSTQAGIMGSVFFLKGRFFIRGDSVPDGVTNHFADEVSGQVVVRSGHPDESSHQAHAIVGRSPVVAIFKDAGVLVGIGSESRLGNRDVRDGSEFRLTESGATGVEGHQREKGEGGVNQKFHGVAGGCQVEMRK